MVPVVILVISLMTCGEIPAPKHIEPIKYPEVARLAHWEGTVTAHIELDSHGKVLGIKTNGRPIFADVIQTSIKNWRFDCTQKGSTDIIFDFQLSGKPRYTAETFITYDLPDTITVVTQPPICDHCKN